MFPDAQLFFQLYTEEIIPMKSLGSILQGKKVTHHKIGILGDRGSTNNADIPISDF